MTQAATKLKLADVQADFHVTQARKRQYEATTGYPTVTVPLTNDVSGTVYRGARSRDALPVYFVQDGTAQPFALPHSALAAVIAGGLITAEELRSFLTVEQLAAVNAVEFEGEAPAA